MRVLFFGTDAFALESVRRVQALRSSGEVASLGVVCPATTKRGRNGKTAPAAVHHWASKQRELAVECFTLAAGKPELEALAPIVREKFDLGVVASFGHFLPRSLIDAFPLGAINVHPSLLPKYRGASPIQSALLHGDHETGVSIITVDKHEFDAGQLLAQVKHPVQPHAMYSELHSELAELGADTLVTVLQDLELHLQNAVPQGTVGISQCSKIGKELSHLAWGNLTAQQVFNKWRAIGEAGSLHTSVTLPDDQTSIDVIVRGIEQVGTLPLPAKWRDSLVPPGSFAIHKRSGKLLVQCREGVVALNKLQARAKKEQSARDFMNGYRMAKGGVFS